MKVVIAYPPLNGDKGVPLLAQNRQFQWFKESTYIYPVVPAYAATLLKQGGYEVYWLDGIAEEWSFERFMDELERIEPDLIFMETKTPVVKMHWGIIGHIKERMPGSKVVLAGDHVTALPEESFLNSTVNYVLTGGDYDFLLLNLSNHITKGETLEPGIWFRRDGNIQNTGKFVLKHDLNSIPFIDRDLTRWHLYAYKNGNYCKTPGTYTMVGRDCWWGKCTFCSWTTLYPDYRARKPNSLLDEIGMLIDEYKVKEIFDDTGTLPAGKWLRDFCNGMIERGYSDKIAFGCNMRFGTLKKGDYILMKRAGFRMVLFGLESANQKTLDRLNKGITVERIVKELKWASKAGLEPHITLMFGYPWESMKMAEKTLELGKMLLRKGYASTVQATVVIPYPGTPLFEYCRKENLLKTLDWERYDMKKPIMITPMKDEELMGLIQGIYKVAFNPEFILRKVSKIRSMDDIKFMYMAGKKVMGHIFDFSKKWARSRYQ